MFVISFHKMTDVPTKSYFARKLFNEVAISREYRFRKRSAVETLFCRTESFFTN